MIRHYIVASVTGAALFIILGYLVYAMPGDAVSFWYWIKHPLRYGILAWATIGAAVGAGVTFVLVQR